MAENISTNSGRCTLGIEGVCTGVANVVHHTLGRAVTGDDVRYLQATCAACNNRVGDPTKHNPQPRRLTRW